MFLVSLKTLQLYQVHVTVQNTLCKGRKVVSKGGTPNDAPDFRILEMDVSPPDTRSVYSRKTSASSRQPDDVALEDGVGPAVRLSDIHVDSVCTNEAPGGIHKDSKGAWLICAAAFLIQVIIVGVLHIFGVFFVEFLREFDTTRAAAAWVGSVAYGLTMMFGPVASGFINRFGVRGAVVAGSLMCSLALFTSSFVPTMPWLFFTFSFTYGLGTSLAYSPTMTIAEDYFNKYLAIATGITVSGSSTGTLVLSPIAQVLVEKLGWRITFRMLSVLALVGVLCGLVFQSTPTAATPAQRVRKSPLSRLVADLHLWKSKVYVIWVLGITLVMFGYYIPYVHLVSQAQGLGLTASQGSTLVMTLGASTATGRIMFGKIITFGILDRLHMHQLSMVITGTATMMLPLIRTFAGLMTYVICVGLVDGCFVVMLPLMTVTLAGVENKVLAWGYLVGVSSITFMLGPPVAGWLYDATGSYNLAFHVAGVPILLGAAVLLFIPWAQRTANITNDALSVVGDFGQISDLGDHASLMLLEDDPNVGANDGGVVGAWAAPSRRRLHEGSGRSSLYSGAESFCGGRREWYEVSWRKDSPSVDIVKGGVAIPVVGTKRCSTDVGRGVDGGPTELTSLPGTFTTTQNGYSETPGKPSGRYRSVSESSGVKDQRAVRWIDDAKHIQIEIPARIGHRQAVEIRDDLFGIFLETTSVAPVRTTSPMLINDVTISGDQSAGRVSGSSTRSSSPVTIVGSDEGSPQTANNNTEGEMVANSNSLWTSPVGSPPDRPVSPLGILSPPDQLRVRSSLASPTPSGQLIPIPEHAQLSTDSLVVISPVTSNSFMSPDAQGIFSMSDVGETSD